eukprot:m.232232 g.232232  ORF g.232232 m.232232 type:complete len:304 (-) comp18639_c0_seq1:1287-2198(-)
MTHCAAPAPWDATHARYCWCNFSCTVRSFSSFFRALFETSAPSLVWVGRPSASNWLYSGRPRNMSRGLVLPCSSFAASASAFLRAASALARAFSSFSSRSRCFSFMSSSLSTSLTIAGPFSRSSRRTPCCGNISSRMRSHSLSTAMFLRARAVRRMSSRSAANSSSSGTIASSAAWACLARGKPITLESSIRPKMRNKFVIQVAMLYSSMVSRAPLCSRSRMYTLHAPTRLCSTSSTTGVSTLSQSAACVLVLAVRKASSRVRSAGLMGTNTPPSAWYSALILRKNSLKNFSLSTAFCITSVL